MTHLCPAAWGPWGLGEVPSGTPVPGKEQLRPAQAASPGLVSALHTEAQSVGTVHSISVSSRYVRGTNSVHRERTFPHEQEHPRG